LIGSERMISKGMKGAKARTLFHDHYLMAQRKGHPRGRKALDLESYCGLSHLLVSTSGGSFHGDIDEQLEKIGRRRRVALSIHQFSLAPIFLRATDYVATLPARFVRRFTGELDVFDLPFKARGYSLAAVWHPRNDADPGHSWLRGESGRLPLLGTTSTKVLDEGRQLRSRIIGSVGDPDRAATRPSRCFATAFVAQGMAGLPPVCSHRNRSRAHAHSLDQHSGDQHLGEPCAQHARRSSPPGFSSVGS
jgi:hypothetical protein